MTLRHDDPAAVIETRLVHGVHRHASSLLVEAAGRPSAPIAAIVELRDFLVAVLEYHHQCEDDDLWPLIAAAAPDLADELGALSNEHEHLDVVLDDLRRVDVGAGNGALTAAAGAVRDLVHEHLAHEEPILFPALRLHVSEEAWAQFSQRTVASAPPEGVHLLVALLDHQGSPEEIDLIFRHLPPEARDLLPGVREQGRAALAALQPGPR